MWLYEQLNVDFVSGVILMSVVHGVLLACIFLFNDRLRSKSNKFLALAILGICVILAYEFIYWFDLEDELPIWIEYFPVYVRSVIPIGLYFFVRFLVQPNLQISTFEKVGFVLIGLELLLDVSFIPVNIFIDDPEEIIICEYVLSVLGWLLSVLAALIYLPRAFLKVVRYQRKLYDNYSTTSGKSLGWLRTFLLLVLFIMVFWITSFVQYVLGYWEACEVTFTIVTAGLVVMLFWLGYSIILKYSWFQIVPFSDTGDKIVKQSNKLSSKTDAYHQDLMDLLGEERLFEDPELTLDRLSERLKISSGYLSQIINEKEGKNFFEFINTYRVEAVKDKLVDDSYHNYTIMGVALESGFKSKSTFNSVFKKFTGHTPSVFKRLHG
ncbi:MAG: helix-turn-helix domain-containing protein [Bacteroidota bacterium]